MLLLLAKVNQRLYWSVNRVDHEAPGFGLGEGVYVDVCDFYLDFTLVSLSKNVFRRLYVHVESRMCQMLCTVSVGWCSELEVTAGV